MQRQLPQNMDSRHNACLKVILEKVHSPVGENKFLMVKHGTDDRWCVENTKNKWRVNTIILVLWGDGGMILDRAVDVLFWGF